LWFNWTDSHAQKNSQKGKNMTQKKKVQPDEKKEALATDNWKFLLKWLFILGGAATGVANALANNPDVSMPDYLIWVFVAIGIVVGLFYFNSDDLINIGLRFMIFAAAARSLPTSIESVFILYITSFLLGFSFYLGPIVLTLAIVYFLKKYILSK
jgi:FtsH-binding integral membrane protein